MWDRTVVDGVASSKLYVTVTGDSVYVTFMLLVIPVALVEATGTDCTLYVTVWGISIVVVMTFVDVDSVDDPAPYM